MICRPQLTAQLCALGVDNPDFEAGFTLLTMAALEAAYHGALDADWRTEFIGPQLAVGGGNGVEASLELPPVAVTLVAMETKEWEPYAAEGNWRRALNAWEFDYAALVGYYFGYYRSSATERKAASDHVLLLSRMMREQLAEVPSYWSRARADTP